MAMQTFQGKEEAANSCDKYNVIYTEWLSNLCMYKDGALYVQLVCFSVGRSF